jgi:hypothetical protein
LRPSGSFVVSSPIAVNVNRDPNWSWRTPAYSSFSLSKKRKPPPLTKSLWTVIPSPAGGLKPSSRR